MNRYLYLIDGEPYLGTLDDYALALQHCAMGEGYVSSKVTRVTGSDWDNETLEYSSPFRPLVKAEEPHDDLVSVIVYGEYGETDSERAYYTIDLRA